MKNNCCDEKSSCGCGCTTSRKNKLCELTKPHNQFDLEKIIPLVNDAKYVCRCCGRLANKKESLCNPLELTNK
jgi:hypothetical protein